MVFQDLRGALINPYRRTVARGDYDRDLRELAIAQPKSSLQVGDLMTDLTAARTDAMAAIRQAASIRPRRPRRRLRMPRTTR